MPGDLDVGPAFSHLGGEAPDWGLANADWSAVAAGGMDWEGEPPSCKGTTKKGFPCGAPPVEGEDFCVGHARARKGAE
jgi:hypothetical protein